MATKTIFWFRQDLRIEDNPGLYEASQMGSVIPIYILDDTQKDFKLGSASCWWLHQSLENLNKNLQGHLNFYKGNPQTILLEIIQNQKAEAVYWNRCYDPWRVQQDSTLKSILKIQGINCKSFNGSLLWEPWDVLKNDGNPYKVFTSFYKNGCLKTRPPRKPILAPNNLKLEKDKNVSLALQDLKLLPTINWYNSLAQYWNVGEKAAHEKLENFINSKLIKYKELRDFPGESYVSYLSPHLHFGEISPNQVWYASQEQRLNLSIKSDNIDKFLTELGWREFSYYLLYHFPTLPWKNFYSKFDQFSWDHNETNLRAWQQGKTGYPIVDAAMRELWQTGYMHNRLRMIVGSFLVKNLLIHWTHGEQWFRDCLVDADLANNSMGWQWVAGTGIDASPYFRIFNPITQGQKFDPTGAYTRRFVPELKNIPTPYLFSPWKANSTILKNAKISLGETYPNPIIDLDFSRKRAIEHFHALKTHS